MRQCRKMWWSQKGHKSRHNMAHTRCMLDKQGYTQARACTSSLIRPATRTHARKHSYALTHTLTHTDKCVILFAFSRQFLREHASMLRHTYIAFHVLHKIPHVESRMLLLIVHFNRNLMTNTILNSLFLFLNMSLTHFRGKVICVPEYV
jgi:hypothetical protein